MDSRREFRLGDWQVTPLRGVLHGAAGSRRLTPKAMDLLLCLANHRGDVVERDTLLREVWGGRVFSDDPLNKAIAELRRQLGDDRGAPAYIETIPKRGYRLVADVEPIGEVGEDGSRGSSTPLSRWYRFTAVLALIALLTTLALQYRATDFTPRDASLSIAVLPFELLSSAESKEYFADGIHEELISALSQNPRLEVRSRTSTLAFRNSDMAIPLIADELDVDVILEGSVRQEGDRVRVTAQLLDGETDAHLWSANYEETLTVAELFAIQNRMALEISGALALTLATAEDALPGDLPTDNLAAYEHFMLGKYHYRRQLPGDIEQSVQNLEAAVALDPEFAHAWDWLAYAYNHAATQVGYLSPREAYPKARTAALRALEIEPDLATAMAILGYIRAVYDWDWVGAERDMRRALDLSPDDSGTVWSLAHTLSMLGRHDAAIALASDFAERNPAIGRRHLEVANRLVDAQRYTEAIGWLDKALENGAELAQVQDVYGTALFGLGQIEAAIERLQMAMHAKRGAAATTARFAHVLAVAEQRDEALRIFGELEERSLTEPISALTMATVLTGLGDQDGAMSLIEAAVAERDRAVLNIGNDTYFRPLADLTRFRRVLDSFGFPAGTGE